MFGLGITELLVILVIVVVIFGPSRLPKVGQALGSSIRGFKNASLDDDSPKDALPEKGNESLGKS
jgi:sec-independent protein translocase protein TatA